MFNINVFPYIGLSYYSYHFYQLFSKWNDIFSMTSFKLEFVLTLKIKCPYLFYKNLKLYFHLFKRFYITSLSSFGCLITLLSTYLSPIGWYLSYTIPVVGSILLFPNLWIETYWSHYNVIINVGYILRSANEFIWIYVLGNPYKTYPCKWQSIYAILW